MTEPLPLPLRVLVKGASTAVWTSWMGGPRSDLPYPRIIEERLLAAGRPAEVRVSALPAERTKDAFKTWEQDVIPWSPDVVVLHYGHFETIHLMAPRWLERYANSLSLRPGLIRMKYHRVVQKVWRAFAVAQQFADQRVDPTIFAWRPRKVAADLERLILRVRNISSPLVLIPDLIEPGPPYQKWFPGMAARSEVMNKTLDEMVTRIGNPEVRRFSVSKVVEGLDLEGHPTPDGGHFSPTVHRAVGEAMADVILEWANGQAHLNSGRRIKTAGQDA